MDEKLPINITIAERRYPMRIERKEEEKIRKAAKIINERILQYRQVYTGKDNQDFMAMSALEFVMKMIDLMENQDIDPAIQQVDQINEELKTYLAKT
jgi:cell division protein ZapA (FtsZ GTPase activity inhibitor)